MNQHRTRVGILPVVLGVIALVLFAGATPAAAQSMAGAEGPVALPEMGDGVTAVPGSSGKALRSARPVARRVALAPLDVEALMAEDAERHAGDDWKRWHRVGKMRDFETVRAPTRLAASKKAERLPNGSYAWRVRVETPGATAIRLRVSRCDLPAGAALFVYDADDPSEIYGPFKGRGPEGDGDFLTPTVFAQAAVLEVRSPERAARRKLLLRVDGVAQSYRDPVEAPANRRNDYRGSLDCMNDVAEDASYFGDVSRAVATLDFTDGGNVYSCSGTLLNDADESTVIPWFLTANHCISTDRVARTVEIFWDYKAATPGGAPPRLEDLPRTVGATLVATRKESDATLLRLTGTLPANRFFAGWTADVQAAGTKVVGVHHPEATHMRISYGTLSASDDDMHTVVWDDGVTAQGSSGSALFNPGKLVIGQLCCGGSYCSAPRDPDFYGRFDKSYPTFRNYLGASGGGSTPPGNDPPAPGNGTVEGDLPQPVTRLKARVRRNGKVILRWKDRARVEFGYRVEILESGSWTRVADLRRNSRRYIHFPGAGTHSYRVGPYNDVGTAFSEVTAVVGGGSGSSGDATDPRDDTAMGATLLSPASGGETGTLTLSKTDRVDWFKVELEKGRTYYFATTGWDDTVGALYGDEGGDLLAENDDDPQGWDLNFGIDFEAPRTGTYWLRVTAFPDTPKARYRLIWESEQYDR